MREPRLRRKRRAEGEIRYKPYATPRGGARVPTDAEAAVCNALVDNPALTADQRHALMSLLGAYNSQRSLTYAKIASAMGVIADQAKPPTVGVKPESENGKT